MTEFLIVIASMLFILGLILLIVLEDKKERKAHLNKPKPPITRFSSHPYKGFYMVTPRLRPESFLLYTDIGEAVNSITNLRRGNPDVSYYITQIIDYVPVEPKREEKSNAPPN